MFDFTIFLFVNGSLSIFYFGFTWLPFIFVFLKSSIKLIIFQYIFVIVHKMHSFISHIDFIDYCYD